MDASMSSVIGSIRINDVPVFWSMDGGESSENGDCREWLKNGVNKLQIDIVKTIQSSGTPSANIGIVSASYDAKGNKLQYPLARLRWPNLDEKISFPCSTLRECELDGLPQNYLWGATEVIKHMDATEKNKVFDRASLLLSAYQRAEISTINKLCNYKFSDLATMTADSENEIRATVNEMVAYRSGQKGFALENALSSETFMEVIADGRLIWVTRKNKMPFLKTTQESPMQWFSHVYFGKIQGNWFVLR